MYGRDGLPVISADGEHLQGWITSQNVIRAVARRVSSAARSPAASGQPGPRRQPGREGTPSPLSGYRILEVTVEDDSPAAGKALADITWPARCIPVTVRHGDVLRDAEPGIDVAAGDRISLLTRTSTR